MVVRTLCITLTLLGMASGALAQQEQAAPPGRFFGPLIPPDGVSKFFRGVPPQPANVAPQPTVSRCAVPLIEMQAPKAGDPAMLLVPRMDKLAPMPRAKLPPACEAPLTR